MTNSPIKVVDLFKLSTIGIPKNIISRGYVRMDSAEYVCVVQDVPSEPTTKLVSIIEVATQKIISHRIKCNLVALHPSSPIMALQIGSDLQLFNYVNSSILKEDSLHSESVKFLKWISHKTIAIVGEKNVYHWSIAGTSGPQLVFSLLQNLMDAEMRDHQCDSSEKWFFMNGLTVNDNTMGVVQLYSFDNQTDYAIADGVLGCFISYPRNDMSLALIALVSGNKESKVSIMDLPSEKRRVFERVNIRIQYQHDDYPVSIHTNEKLGLLYLLTCKGFVYLIEIESGSILCTQQIHTDNIFFLSTPEIRTHGVIAVDEKIGNVYSISVDELQLVKYLEANQQYDLAKRISSKCDPKPLSLHPSTTYASSKLVIKTEMNPLDSQIKDDQELNQIKSLFKLKCQEFEEYKAMMEKQLLKSKSDLDVVTHELQGLRKQTQFEFSSQFLPFDKLSIQREISRGGFASVWDSSQRIAVKKISKKQMEFSEFELEVMIHKNSNHPNIVDCYGWTEDPDYYYMLMELMDGDLTRLIGKKILKVETKLEILVQIGLAMCHLHEKHVVHRDLKPNNILYKKSKDDRILIKLSDFGISKEKSQDDTYSVTLNAQGTKAYMSPELLEDNRYSYHSDVYAYGILMYEILYEMKPYSDEIMNLSPMKFGIEIGKGTRPKMNLKLDSKLEEKGNLMEECWVEDPKKRPTFAEIVMRLQI
jgi:hypothetical protein